MIHLKIKGLNETLARINKYSKELAAKIDKEIKDGADNVATGARLRAPKGKTGVLAASIITGRVGSYSYFVSVPPTYAPFVEFGTGIKVFKTPEFNFSPEMKSYAREFYVSGKGKQSPSPFLFPALEKEKPRIVSRVRAILLKNVKV